MATPENTQRDLTSPSERTKAAEKAAMEKAKAAPDQREKVMQALKKSAKDQIASAQTKLISEGKPLNASTQQYIENYFKGSIDRFDKDMDGKISKAEAKTFKEKMLAKTKEIINKVSSVADKHEKISKAVAKVEAIDMKTANKSIESIKDIDKISDLASANKQMIIVQGQNQAFQGSVQNQLTEIQKFGADFQKFQTRDDGIGGNLRGLVETVFGSKGRDYREKAMQKKLDDTKSAANKVLNNLTAKKTTLDANGEKIKDAIAQARKNAIEKRDETVKKVKKAATEQKEKLEERQKQYKKLQEAKEKMQKRQKSIQGRQAKVENLKEKWNDTSSKANLDVKEKAYKEGGKDIDSEIQGYKLILSNQNVSAGYKKKIKLALKKAQERKGKNDLGLKVIDLKRKSGTDYEKQLDENGKKASAELQTVDGYLKRQEETSIGLSNNIATLEQLQLATATKGKEVTDIYNKRITAIDKHSKMVSDFMLDASIGRTKSLSAVSEATKSLNSVTVKSKGFFELVNPLNIVGNLSKDIGRGVTGVAHWMDKNTKDVLDMTRKGGISENWFIHGATQFTSVFTGFLGGGLELVGGLFTLTGNLGMDIGSMPDALLTWDSSKLHVFRTLKGLGAIIGYDTAKGGFSFEKFTDTWATMGKSLIGYGTNWGYTKDAKGKEVWRDEYGTGLGKGVFNVLSMFIGAGEAKAAKGAASAAKVGSATGKASIAGESARIAAIEAAESAGKTVGRFTGRGAQTLAFSKTFVKSIKLPTIIKEASTEARLAEGAVGKTWAVTKTLGRGAGRGLKHGYEGGKKLFEKKAMKVNGKVVRRTPLGNAIRQVPRVSLKVSKEIVLLPYKLTWNVLKSLRNTGEAFSNVSRGVFNHEAVVAAKSAAKMGKAGTIIEQYGADYAKAQSRINEIIQGDIRLSNRSAKIEAMGPGKAAARQTLETEVVQKLVLTEPELAKAYTKVRRAYQELQEEAATYARITRKNIEGVTQNPTIKADYVKYNKLQRDLRRAEKAGDSTQVLELQEQISNMEKNSGKMKNVQQYEGAISARKGLKQNIAELNNLTESLINTQTKEAAQLADELLEAKRAVAPDDIAMADASFTRAPGFIDDFIKKYDDAVKSTDQAAQAELKSNLGTVHKGSALEQALDGIQIRRTKNIPKEPEVSNSFKLNERQKIQDALEEGVKTNDYTKYNALKNQTSGAIRNYVNWMEDRYKTLTTKEARSVILSDSTSFAEALKENQRLSLQNFEKFENKILKGITEQELASDMQKANLNPTWQKALEQMRQRNSFINMYKALTGNVALSQLRSEYARIINPEMNAVEATDKLQARYRNDSMGLTARNATSGHSIIEKVRLTDGIYSMRVLDDGSVRLFNSSNEMIMSKAEAKAVQSRMGITSDMTAEEAANTILERYKQQGSQVGAGESRIVTKELVLKDGQYTLKLSKNGELQVFTDQGTRVKPTVAPPAPAPTPSIVPKPQPVAIKQPVSPTKQFQNADLSMESILRQPKDTTVAYGTESSTGDWIEITKVADDKYRVVKVRNGAIDGAPLDDVSNLRIVEEGGRHKLTWDHAGGKGEYSNIGEIYKDVKLLTPAKGSKVSPRIATETILDDATKEKITDLEQQVGQLEQQVARKNRGIAGLEGELEATRMTQGDLGKVEQKLSEAQAKASTLKDQLSSARADVASGGTKPTSGLSSLQRKSPVEKLKSKITKAEESLEILRKRREIVGKAANRRKVVLEEITDTKEALQGTRRVLNWRERMEHNRTMKILKREQRQISRTMGGDTPSSIDAKIFRTETKVEAYKTKLITAKSKMVSDLEAKITKNNAKIARYKAQANMLKTGQTTTRPITEISDELATARRESDQLHSDLITAKAELNNLKGKSAPGPTASERESATQTVGAESRVEALRDRKIAVETYRTSREKVIELEDRMAPLELRLEAMEGGSTPKLQVEAIKRKLKALDAEKKGYMAKADEAAEVMWKARKDYWKSRIQNASTAVRERIGIQRRVDWIKSKSEFVGKIAELSTKALTVPAQDLWEAIRRQEKITTGSEARLQLFGITGSEIIRRMETLRSTAGAGSPVGVQVLHHLAMNQYEVLKAVEGDGTQKLSLPSKEKFEAMSPEDQIKTLGGGYSQLEGLETGQEKNVYTKVETDYIKGKRETFEKTLTSVSNNSDLNSKLVTEALDTAFGPQGLNDSRKAYEVKMEGITMKVDAEGNRTYEGIEDWVKGAPTRKTVRGILAAKSAEYEKMSPKVLAKESDNKKLKTADEFQDHVAKQIQNSIIKKYNQTGEYLATASFDSTEKMASGKPIYTVNIDNNGKIEVAINKTWAEETYKSIMGRPEPEPTKTKTAQVARSSATKHKKPESKNPNPDPDPDDSSPYP